MNPILPKHHFVPDVEGRQWADGRMYLYGSYDINGDAAYCSREYHVFSSADLLHWEDHGVSFTSAAAHTAPLGRLYAPDCFLHDGTYYLAYCQSAASEGIASSDKPQGPFRHARAVVGADGDAIDPAVLVDDDGIVYYYWGQFNLRGARLSEDLRSVDETTLETDLLTEAAHGFHEGASIRKVNGLYYLVYTDISRGRATCLSWATSSSPLGPFTKGGILIDNTGCDMETWNNHGSIEKFNDRWYVFYHRSSQGSRYNRRVCIEPITFAADGSIPEVEMTTRGASPALDPCEVIEAWRACLLSGNARTKSTAPIGAGEEWSECLTFIQNGDWAAYKHINFDRPVTEIRVTAGSFSYGGVIDVRCDCPTGDLLCTCRVEHTGGWRNWATFKAPLLQKVAGVRAVYLVFKGEGRLFDLLDFRFC